MERKIINFILTIIRGAPRNKISTASVILFLIQATHDKGISSKKILRKYALRAEIVMFSCG